jgi:hypothetical protein
MTIVATNKTGLDRGQKKIQIYEPNIKNSTYARGVRRMQSRTDVQHTRFYTGGPSARINATLLTAARQAGRWLYRNVQREAVLSFT